MVFARARGGRGRNPINEIVKALPSVRLPEPVNSE